MDREQMWARWAPLEILLNQVLTAEQHRLLSEDVEQVREWIDHREFGLAFERLQDAFASQGIFAGEQSDKAMKEAAGLMGLQEPLPTHLGHSRFMGSQPSRYQTNPHWEHPT